MSDENDRPEEQDEDVYFIDGDDSSLQEAYDQALKSSPEEDEASTGPAVETDPGSATEVEQLRNQLLRSRADFDNFRKRMEREKGEYRKYALSELIRQILPVIDNFERALSSPHSEGEEFRKGVELIYKQLLDVLKREGVRPVEEAPVPFDPTFHEAITREENTGFEPHTVIDVLQKGYFLHDRLLRPAMVRVAVDSEPAGSQNENAE
ncbi:MAG: nucleotide exchange factor GrpE [Thermoanaerobaculia bacterium]